MGIKKTTKEFEAEMQSKYPGLSAVEEYRGGKVRMVIKGTCGHEWEILPGHLLQRGTGSRCRKCNQVGKATKSPEVFKEEFFKKFPELTLLDTYVNSTTRLKVKGSCSHEWEISPNSIYTSGAGKDCPICKDYGAALRKPESQVVEEILKVAPGLTVLGKYTGSNDLLLVQGPCTHTWSIIPNVLINRKIGTTCRECYRLGKEEEVREIIESNGLNMLTEYTGAQKYIVIECEKGHQWEALPGNLKYYNHHKYCTTCFPNHTSKGEEEVLDYIKSIYTGWVYLSDKLILEGRELDIVIPDLGIAIEFNGTYWHSDIFRDKNYHIGKTRGVEHFGYQLIQIAEHEWMYKKEIVKARLNSILGVYSRRLFARNCEVRSIPFPKEFITNNHLQGAGSNPSYSYGLFYGEELVSVMTFGTSRFNLSYDYELLRYCSILNTQVVGGASKILSRFKKDYPNSSLISYSDKRWSNGNVYKSIGFEFSHYSGPGYFHVKGMDILSRFKTSKAKLLLKYSGKGYEESTEFEIMSAEGYHRIYDCGNDAWVIKRPAL